MSAGPPANVAVVAPCLMVIFGATGDLTKRLLLPSLYNLVAAQVLPSHFCLLGVAVEDWSREQFRQHVHDSLLEFWGSDANENLIAELTSRAEYQRADFGQAQAFDQLAEVHARLAHTIGSGNTLFYMAVAPGFIAPLSTQLSRVGLLTEEDGCWRRLVIEKPFGHDLPSAVALNEGLQANLREEQIYRIDHFAGKDAVQDLVTFRFLNAIIEPLWNRVYISHIEITAAETVGVERRAAYYETAGALRDMVPNHLAELLSLVAMEPPISLAAEHMRDKQVEVLNSIRRIKPEEVSAFAVRGQYTAGEIDGHAVSGYREEAGVAPNSQTETYVALRVEIENWRWNGVPIYLRTGKRLRQQSTQIVVTFRQPPARLFSHVDASLLQPNRFVFQLQPSPGIQLNFGARVPGLGDEVAEDSMAFQFAAGTFGDHAKGYERLLHDVMVGNQALFQRAAFVEAGWRLVQPLLEAWSRSGGEEMPQYPAGSMGPADAKKLIGQADARWYLLGDE